VHLTKISIIGAALLGLVACTTAPAPSAPAAATPAAPAARAPAAPAVPTGPSPAVLAAGEQTFSGICAGCHNGAGRAPAKDVLAAKAPGEIVAALTTGKMAGVGANLSADQKTAVATYLTGKSPT